MQGQPPPSARRSGGGHGSPEGPAEQPSVREKEGGPGGRPAAPRAVSDRPSAASRSSSRAERPRAEPAWPSAALSVCAAGGRRGGPGGGAAQGAVSAACPCSRLSSPALRTRPRGPCSARFLPQLSAPRRPRRRDRPSSRDVFLGQSESGVAVCPSVGTAFRSERFSCSRESGAPYCATEFMRKAGV